VRAGASSAAAGTVALDVPEQSEPSVATGPLHTALSFAGVASLRELADKPTHDVIADLDRMPIPPSEAILGALVFHAVHELHEATERLDSGTSRLLTLTWALVLLAALTLAAAVVTVAG
jgi:hypothetical protein